MMLGNALPLWPHFCALLLFSRQTTKIPRDSECRKTFSFCRSCGISRRIARIASIPRRENSGLPQAATKTCNLPPCTPENRTCVSFDERSRLFLCRTFCTAKPPVRGCRPPWRRVSRHPPRDHAGGVVIRHDRRQPLGLLLHLIELRHGQPRKDPRRDRVNTRGGGCGWVRSHRETRR